MKKKVVIAGNPNCGKTSIYNQLTGLNQEVSNLAGTTVEIQQGHFSINEYEIALTDLPGAYSIYGDTIDQKLAIQELINEAQEYDLLVYVCNVNQLHRNLLFFAQLSSLQIPCCMIINMFDTHTLSESELQVLHEKLGIEVIPYSAKFPHKYANLREVISRNLNQSYCQYYHEIYPENASIYEGKDRANRTIKTYQKTTELLGESSTVKEPKKAEYISKKLDRVLMHPIFGFIIFSGIMYLLFQTLFTLAEYPMNWIDGFFLWASQNISSILPEGTMLSSLIMDGVLPGIGGVIIFIPQIALLFILLGILEDTGYVSRISYLLNNILSKFGLGGRSIIPMVSGFACAIPAIMSARTIGNSRERLITMMVTPLITCSARLPVYTILIGLLAVNYGGFWSDSRGIAFFLLYMTGLFAALIFAMVFNLFLKTKKENFFILELPEYRRPILSNVFKTTWIKTLQFLKGAGKIIFIVSIILWFLASFGPSEKRNSIHKKYATMEMNDSLDQAKNAELLESSFAGIMGKGIEPAIKPLGYDWKIGIAIIASFAAREVFVGTISTIFAIEAEEDDLIINRLRNAKNSEGKALFNFASIISLLLFYAFALQCVSTIAVMRRETNGWKWPLIQLLYMSILAYLAAFTAYQLFS